MCSSSALAGRFRCSPGDPPDFRGQRGAARSKGGVLWVLGGVLLDPFVFLRSERTFTKKSVWRVNLQGISFIQARSGGFYTQTVESFPILRSLRVDSANKGTQNKQTKTFIVALRLHQRLLRGYSNGIHCILLKCLKRRWISQKKSPKSRLKMWSQKSRAKDSGPSFYRHAHGHGASAVLRFVVASSSLAFLGGFGLWCFLVCFWFVVCGWLFFCWGDWFYMVSPDWFWG